MFQNILAILQERIHIYEKPEAMIHRHYTPSYIWSARKSRFKLLLSKLETPIDQVTLTRSSFYATKAQPIKATSLLTGWKSRNFYE